MVTSTLLAFAMAVVLLLSDAVGTISTPMQAHRWDYRADWRPMLHSAADAVLGSTAAPLPDMKLGQVHDIDCRVASTVRYDIEISMSNKGQTKAAASFYDDFDWAPLSGLTVHTDLWANSQPQGARASAQVRPQLLELPSAPSDEATAPWSRSKSTAAAAASSQMEPLHPSQLPTEMDIAMPNHVRVWVSNPESSKIQIV